MGSVRQNKKRRSSRPMVRQSKSKKVLNPKGNSVIAKNWNKNETLAQNYRRLGLSSRLQAPAGGVEALAQDLDMTAERRGQGALPIAPMGSARPKFEEVRVERDAEGRIVRILRPENPLRDPLNGLDSDSDGDDKGDGKGEEEWRGIDDEEARGQAERNKSRPVVIVELERQARLPELKQPRSQSGREVEWLRRLVDRHGEDTAAMARDHRLNPMQQTEADIARRIKKLTKV